jgi:hypothetical protein
MGTILIIIAVLAIALAVFVWLHMQKNIVFDPDSLGQPVTANPVASVPGWELRSIPLGQYVVINGKSVEICYIALVNDWQPKFNYTYTVDCDFEYVDGRQTITTSGAVGSNITFTANGKSYYGTILAGAPGAKVTDIRKLVVK